MNNFVERLRLRYECTAGFTRDIFMPEDRDLDLLVADEIVSLEQRIKDLEAGDCRFHCRRRREK